MGVTAGAGAGWGGLGCLSLKPQANPGRDAPGVGRTAPGCQPAPL